MTSHEPENPQFAVPDVPDTEVISVAAPAPVFVDSTGRRSRLLRRLAYAFGALVMLYGGLISVSLAGGPVRSSAVLPLPGLEPETDSDTKATPKPSPTPAPMPSHSPTALFVTDALPRRTTAPHTAEPRLEPTRVATTPAATKRTTTKATPKPTVTTTKPTESTTVPVTAEPTTTEPATEPTTGQAAPPSPAAVDTGGQGGGSTSSAAPAESEDIKTEDVKTEAEPIATPSASPAPEASA